MNRIAVFALALAAGFAGLAGAADDKKAVAAAALDRTFEEYFEENLKLNPVQASSIGDYRYNDQFPVSISPEHRAKSTALDKKYLKAVKAIDPKQLDEQRALSREIFIRARERSLAGDRFPTHLAPVNQFYMTPNFFAQLGSGAGAHPFRNVKDYEDFLKRVDGFVAWTDQAIVNMREGIKVGWVQPKVLMEKVLPQLESQMKDDPMQTVYWTVVGKFPESFSLDDRIRLEAAYRTAITTKIVPSYRKLHAFIKDEYLPKCRDTVGADALPDGKAFYEFLVEGTTTTSMKPAEIHALGLSEVARIHGEMRALMKEVGFVPPAGSTDDLQAFFKFMKEDPRWFWNTREELIDGYVQIRKRIDPNLPKLFGVLPKADYEVRAVEPFRERSASGGSYSAASEDGSRPGVFYANAYDLKSRHKWAMEALSLHEGNPGHHFQITVAREQKGLPRFRRFGGYTAYSEGWGLYAESLGKDLGAYVDPYQRFGQLDGELWRAIRLVVDTGLHSKGWTRAQVLDYMRANSSRGESSAVSEAERYMAIPSQALAYKIGELKFKQIRAKAEKELGAKFDIRGFHDELLRDGALPLDVLERKMDRWIAAQK
jgi:uncharacterized protein (DUF885 family)